MTTRRKALIAARALLVASCGARGLSVHASAFTSEKINNVKQEFDQARAHSPWTIGFVQPNQNFLATPTLQKLHGNIPVELEGKFYRNGPALYERNGFRSSHWIDGDGMVQSFSISGRNNNVAHRAAYVATQKWLNEESLGRFNYAQYASQPPNIEKFDHWNTANTSVLPVGDSLWALWEGGAPYVLDGESLETLSMHRFSEELEGAAFSAHPKIEPHSDDIWNFGQLADKILLYRLNRAGKLKKIKLLNSMPLGLIHDFVVTKKYLILGFPPFQLESFEYPILDGYKWRSDKATTFIVIDKNTMEPVRKYDLAPFFFFHYGNAWEHENGDIQFDLVCYPDASNIEQDMKSLVRGQQPEKSVSNSHALVTLSKSGKSAIEMLPLRDVEFPKLHMGFTGRLSRFHYMVRQHKSHLPNTVSRMDILGGEVDEFIYGANCIAEEHIFIASKKNPDKESLGWVIGTTLNIQTQRTELNIFNAQSIADGPMAKFTLPYALPLGFHGAWQGRKE